MSKDLVLEDGYLEQLRSGYVRAQDVFASAGRDTSGIASVVGDRSLENRVRDFYTGWESRRTELIDAVESLQESVVTIAESFEQLDTELGQAAAAMP